MNALKILAKILGLMLVVIGVVWGVRSLNETTSLSKVDELNDGAQILARSAQISDSQNIAIGANLYATNCASCHGINLEGQANWRNQNIDGTPKAPPHDDTGHTWHHDDAMLFNYTKLGGKALMTQSGVSNFVSGMPGFSDTLTDEQIHQVLTFIKSRWSANSRKVQRERSRIAAGK